MFRTFDVSGKCIPLFGVALAMLMPVQSAGAAEGFRVVHRFQGSPNDGDTPEAGLVVDKYGTLYGTTVSGGIQNNGIVFSLTREGIETILYMFKGGSDGGNPESTLVRDKAGNLYGTTAAGGNLNCYPYASCGTVFRIAPDGTETVLYAFNAGDDGVAPEGALIEDRRGNFYGTTLAGGKHDFGTVFKLKADGSETILHAFKGGHDGAYPTGGVIMDKAGNLYGTTQGVEAKNCRDCGTVFKLAPDGTETVLWAFTGGSDGATPYAGVLMDSAGNLYGTTFHGGSVTGGDCGTTGCGVVFKLDTRGNESVLYTFCAADNGCADGAQPEGGLIQDIAGNFYGTTVAGGTGRGEIGTIFRLAPNGSETVLHSFNAKRDGIWPVTSLVLDKHHLYGAALEGGDHSARLNGLIFRASEFGDQ